MKDKKFFEELEKMYMEGYTHQSIADHFEMNRNAISFHINNLGLSKTRKVNREMRKERLEKSRLDDSDVRRLLSMRLTGTTYTQLCQEFNIPRGYCFDIVRGKKYLTEDKVIALLRKKLNSTIKKRKR